VIAVMWVAGILVRCYAALRTVRNSPAEATVGRLPGLGKAAGFVHAARH